MAVIFPDVEKLLVGYLQDALNAYSVDARVGTKKLPADSTPPAFEVVLNAQYTGELDWVRHEASVVLDIWGSDYEATSELALLVAALIVEIPKDYIKRVVVTLGPVRLTEEAPLERRSITADLVVKGSNL